MMVLWRGRGMAGLLRVIATTTALCVATVKPENVRLEMIYDWTSVQFRALLLFGTAPTAPSARPLTSAGLVAVQRQGDGYAA